MKLPHSKLFNTIVGLSIGIVLACIVLFFSMGGVEGIQCTVSGGQWRTIDAVAPTPDMSPLKVCLYTYSDGGKPCIRSSSECKGKCIVDDVTGVGHCSHNTSEEIDYNIRNI